MELLKFRILITLRSCPSRPLFAGRRYYNIVRRYHIKKMWTPLYPSSQFCMGFWTTICVMVVSKLVVPKNVKKNWPDKIESIKKNRMRCKSLDDILKKILSGFDFVHSLTLTICTLTTRPNCFAFSANISVRKPMKTKFTTRSIQC